MMTQSSPYILNPCAGDQLTPVCDTGPMLQSAAALFPWGALEQGLAAQRGPGALAQPAEGLGGEMGVFDPDEDRGRGALAQVPPCQE